MGNNTLNLSKSKYCSLWQCPKMAWLLKNMPSELLKDESVVSRMEAGIEIGNLAKGLFGDYVEVTAHDGEKLDLSRMIGQTLGVTDDYPLAYEDVYIPMKRG